MAEEVELQADLAAKKAYQEGFDAKAIETAQKMLEENISADIVAKCTSLPLEQVLELQKEANLVKT